jgi:hypothetical protein
MVEEELEMVNKYLFLLSGTYVRSTSTLHVSPT